MITKKSGQTTNNHEYLRHFVNTAIIDSIRTPHVVRSKINDISIYTEVLKPIGMFMTAYWEMDFIKDW